MFRRCMSFCYEYVRLNVGAVWERPKSHSENVLMAEDVWNYSLGHLVYKVATCQHLLGIVIFPNWTLESKDVGGVGRGQGYNALPESRRDCALVADSPLVVLRLGLNILFIISRLRVYVIDNNNGVQCCPPRGAAFQRYWLLSIGPLSLSKWALHPNPRQLPVWVQQGLPAGHPRGVHRYAIHRLIDTGECCNSISLSVP